MIKYRFRAFVKRSQRNQTDVKTDVIGIRVPYHVGPKVGYRAINVKHSLVSLGHKPSGPTIVMNFTSTNKTLFIERQLVRLNKPKVRPLFL